jgi:hypothetical protein
MTRIACFLIEPQNQARQFLSLSFKTSSSGLIIWTSKLPRWFLSLGIKTKRASVCRLRHKIDGERSTQDTHRDVASCFNWKHVGVGFLILTSRLVEARLCVVHVASSWRSRGVKTENGRVDVMGHVGPFYSKIIIFYVLCHICNLVFYLSL